MLAIRRIAIKMKNKSDQITLDNTLVEFYAILAAVPCKLCIVQGPPPYAPEAEPEVDIIFLRSLFFFVFVVSWCHFCGVERRNK